MRCDTAALPAYNAAYYLPFGGQGPGPRFLVPALPFLALPLALALRSRPLVVAGVGVVSVSVMVLATVTDPLTGVEYGIGTWLDALGNSDLVETVPRRLGVESPWPGAVIVALLVLVACAVSLVRLPLRAAARGEAALLAGVLCAWLLFAVAAPGARSGGRRARDARGRRGRRGPRSGPLGRSAPRIPSRPDCIAPADSPSASRDSSVDGAAAMVAPPRDVRARQRRRRLGARAAQRGPDRRADAIRETVGFTSVKALIVSFYFPPAGGGGVQRPLKLAQYLPAMGIETHVLARRAAGWWSPDRAGGSTSPEVAGRVERDQPALTPAVDVEVVCHREEILHGLHGTRTVVGKHRMAVDVRVLHNQVTPGRHEGPVGLELAQNVVAAVVRVEDDHHALRPPGTACYSIDDAGVGR